MTHLITASLMGAAAGGRPAAGECRVVREGSLVALHSPFFVLHLDTARGLCARGWENRRTGSRTLLDGPELGVDVGLPGGPLTTAQWSEARVLAQAPGDVTFEMRSEEPRLRARLTYRWDAEQPVLRKFVAITNEGAGTLERLLNVRLGDYATGARAQAPVAERGFPVYVADEYFLSLAHPAGIAGVEGGKVSLRHYPGARLAPGATFTCMEAVYGVGAVGGARQAFLDHLTRRMRRTVRGHDRPYALFEPFGARPGGDFNETEEFVLDSIARVAQGQRDAGCRFDFYSVDFWVDFRGTLKECDPERFPNGLARIREALAGAGIAPGLWIDSSGLAWSIGGNPAVKPCLNSDPARPETVKERSWGRESFCRAAEPIRSMYSEAFRHHIRENGARLLKFDNLASDCVNPGHDHLPGIYSTEAIYDSVIEFLHAMDQECPDVFLMLYWGYRSPWWLLHGDTLFDSGLGIEAASPSTFATPHARDSVTQKLDQAQWHASDVPALGKDSLGVWLSDWGWNSSIGKERWQEGFVMDLCRGSLLAQPWSDTPWLSPPEREQMADFLALLRARPECFRNPRFVVGSPWRAEPYGYCCTDGRRAMVAVNNCSWKEQEVTLHLGPEWGLPAGRQWDLYRWYPEPARLRDGRRAFGETAAVLLRPFEVALFEVVPAGEKPALDRQFEERDARPPLAGASQDVDLTVHSTGNAPAAEDARWSVLRPARCVSKGGAVLTLQPDGSVLAGGDTPSPDTYALTAETDVARITAFRLEALPDPSLPGQGPGRAVNGNFCLAGLRVKACPRGREAEAAPVALRTPAADFSQESHGGWPVAAALDDDPKSGWSIDPEEGLAHEAVFETAAPAGFAGGTTLVIEMDQGERGHSLGRFRVSVTDAPPPHPVRRHGPEERVIAGVAPAAPAGGLLVITVEMARDGHPLEMPNIGKVLSAEGTLERRPAAWEPVLGQATYPSCWQAWRLRLAPSVQPRAFTLTVTPRVAREVLLRCRGHFLVER